MQIVQPPKTELSSEIVSFLVLVSGFKFIFVERQFLNARSIIPEETTPKSAFLTKTQCNDRAWFFPGLKKLVSNLL